MSLRYANLKPRWAGAKAATTSASPQTREGAVRALADAIRKGDMNVRSVRNREHLLRPAEFQRELREAKAKADTAIVSARKAVDAAIDHERTENNRTTAPTAEQAARSMLYVTRGMALSQAGTRDLVRAIRNELAAGNKEAAREYFNAGGSRLRADMNADDYAAMRRAVATTSDAKRAAFNVGLDAYASHLGSLDQYVEKARQELGAGNLDAVDQPTRGDVGARLVTMWQERVEGLAADAGVAEAQAFATAGGVN